MVDYVPDQQSKRLERVRLLLKKNPLVYCMSRDSRTGATRQVRMMHIQDAVLVDITQDVAALIGMQKGDVGIVTKMSATQLVVLLEYKTGVSLRHQHI